MLSNLISNFKKKKKTPNFYINTYNLGDDLF